MYPMNHGHKRCHMFYLSWQKDDKPKSWNEQDNTSMLEYIWESNEYK
jgi:aspartyl/asparaginyl beta-hydroxylase (cupin superfamily)